MAEVIILLLVGFLVGIIGYLLGLGGGALIVPVLVVWFKMPIHTAIATSLIAITASSFSSSVSTLGQNLVNIRLAISLETVTVVGAVTGSMISVNLGDKIISAVFAAVMFITAVIMILKKDPANKQSMTEDAPSGFLDGHYIDVRTGEDVSYKVYNIIPTGAVSVVAGFLSGFLGVGGGVFKVPAMNIVSKIPIKAATATSTFMIGITAAAGSVAYIAEGHADAVVASTIVLGAAAGVWFSTKKLKKITDKKIQYFFVGFVVLIALQMLFETFK